MILRDLRQWVFPFLWAPLLGLLSVVVPAVALSPMPEEAPVFSLVRTGVEHMSWLTLTLLFLSGVVLGGGFRHKSCWLSSFLVMAALPAVTIVEVIADGTSHNLWPLEFLVYGGLTLVSLLGAGMGVLLRKKAQQFLGGSKMPLSG